jgi:hypothetical protein
MCLNMSRKRAFWILTILLLSIGIYSGWCLRPFLIKPELEFGPDIPANAVSSIVDWHREHGLEPPKLTNHRVLYALMHPYADTVVPATVERVGTVEIWVRHGEQLQTFLIRDGSWQVGPSSKNFPFP